MVKTEINQSKNNLIVFTTLKDDGNKHFGKLICLNLSSGIPRWQVIDSTGTDIENSNDEFVIVSQFYNTSAKNEKKVFIALI